MSLHCRGEYDTDRKHKIILYILYILYKVKGEQKTYLVIEIKSEKRDRFLSPCTIHFIILWRFFHRREPRPKQKRLTAETVETVKVFQRIRVKAAEAAATAGNCRQNTARGIPSR